MGGREGRVVKVWKGIKLGNALPLSALSYPSYPLLHENLQSYSKTQC